MSTRANTTLVGALVLASALVAAAVQLQAARERWYPPAKADDETMYLRSGTAIRRIAGAYAAVASDLYWIRAIQYYGGTKRSLQARPEPEPPPMLAADSGRYGLLYPMLDITTTLDPRFAIAYRFGAVFLAERYPNGPDRPDLAIALLEKGVRTQPEKWQYLQDIGFVHYWYSHDYAAAADAFQRASEVSGAPWWLKSLAATTLAQGGDRRSSRVMWEAIRQSAEIDWLRQDAERRLAQLRALDDIDALQERVDAFARAMGSTPASWAVLVQARRLQGIPLDPGGTAYELTPAGRVRLARSSVLWPLPEEPPQLTPSGTRPPS
jgi:hypothetical protein